LGYLKPRIKKRKPKNLDEIKIFTLDERKLIPKERIKNCELNSVLLEELKNHRN
jgi:hypothetical protein